jgi:O-antigen ligase/polysaccharide polymerase Wzy-like membrane protein
MRTIVLNGARAALLAGPTALAFFAGGYFDEARAWAGLGAWILVVVGIVVSPHALPRGRNAWLALGGLGLLAAWTLLSILWAPVAGSAYHAGQLAVLYVGALLAAAVLLRSVPALRAVEPALAAGTLIVIGYAISERLLPGVLHFSHSISAQGRLEQPLTYWNAMGELAALGFVICARLAGDVSRSIRLRAAAAAATAPLGLGLYLSFSRGALFACGAGLVALVVLVPWREQLVAILVSIAAAVLASVAAAPFSGVTTLLGSQSKRETQGAITLVLLVVIAIAAGGSLWRLARRERSTRLPLPRAAPLIALGAICIGLALAIVVGAKERSSRPLSAGASRYVTLQSNRYAYWRVAMRAFEAQPLRGVGAGGWAVYWLRYRPIDEFAQDAHSLPLQTLAELGLVGLALLAVFLAGLALTAREAHRAAPMLAAGPIAGFTVWIAHSPLDWDWQMPAVTLVAMVLAGALLSLAREDPDVVRPATAETRVPASLTA